MKKAIALIMSMILLVSLTALTSCNLNIPLYAPNGLQYIINADGSSVHTTEMMALNIYNTFYGQNTGARGVAQAKAVLFFILVAGLSVLQLRMTRDKEVAA